MRVIIKGYRMEYKIRQTASCVQQRALDGALRVIEELACCNAM